MSESKNTNDNAKTGDRVMPDHRKGLVFVSYASQDAKAADAIVRSLEEFGVPCWLAPRDVTPGAVYADAIIQAINGSVVLVLVLSGSSIASKHVGKEVERASSKGRPIITVRLDNAPLTSALEYFLSESQWIDCGVDGQRSAHRKLLETVNGYVLSSTPNSQTPIPGASNRYGLGRWRFKTSIALAFTVVTAIVLVAYLIWPTKQMAPKPQTAEVAALILEKSVAVLPFVDMSEKRDQEYFGDGIAEEISSLLAQIPHIRMIGRASSVQVGTNSNPQAIGAKLDAAYIVDGSVRKSGASDYGDVLNLQRQIAEGIARALELVFESEDVTPARALRNPEAYTQYLRGLSELDQMHQSSLFDAQSNFEHALNLDPSFLRAAEALARTYVEQAFDESLLPKIAWQKARDVANRALQLDPGSATAHGVLGMVYAANDYNWEAAEAEFGKAISLRPRDPVTLRYAALVTHARGRQEEALRRINASISVDPLDPYARESLGQILFCMGDLERAEPAFRKSLEITPLFDGSHYYLGLIYLLGGQADGARREVRAEVAENARDSGMSMELVSLFWLPQRSQNSGYLT